ncbi:paeninodin family lasso peptide [Cohnella lubricantis]|uniref:Paeninodin family lasso peptide n=1 Tax=Cohnella lubricantis TaxID=2163172 RepID=A0A841T7E6_9BACL|nr:paeninodin family lasso peptide [Cohnella lubricantis]MBB6676822.1 paeninodin family lasso peptide [Cohnella lubricantis]MBP2119401.1 hypothetical protein [Cohnella lubricantis]
MNKEWTKPVLEALDIKMTLAGSPDTVRDFLDTDGHEELNGPS